MTRKQKRLATILGGLAILGVAAGLVLYALSDAIVFFYTPSEVVEKQVGPGQRIRLGGLVEKGSLVRGSDANVSFVVTDMTKALPVAYRGQLPDLFREGQGVVAEGSLDPSGIFQADTVLAKHDETYMPKDVADRLKEQGVWREGEGQ
jgi:cytochrome c-type biogenesis protein CcmE